MIIIYKNPFRNNRRKGSKQQKTNLSTLRIDIQSLVLEPVPRVSRHNLTRAETQLPDTISQRRAVVVYVTDKLPTATALDLRAFPLNAPVIKGLEERSDFIFFLESELGGIDGGERKCIFVAGLEIKVRWVEVDGIEVETSAALPAAVYRRHGCKGFSNGIYKARGRERGEDFVIQRGEISKPRSSGNFSRLDYWDSI